MRTMPRPAVPMPLHRPWLLRLVDAVVERWRAPRTLQEADLGVLAELSPRTLRDIGAPDWVQERVRGQADQCLQTARDRTTWRVL